MLDQVAKTDGGVLLPEKKKKNASNYRADPYFDVSVMFIW